MTEGSAGIPMLQAHDGAAAGSPVAGAARLCHPQGALESITSACPCSVRLSALRCARPSCSSPSCHPNNIPLTITAECMCRCADRALPDRHVATERVCGGVRAGQRRRVRGPSPGCAAHPGPAADAAGGRAARHPGGFRATLQGAVSPVSRAPEVPRPLHAPISP